MRRSEVSALRWADVDDAADGDGVLVTVRRGKTNQEGETRDVRFVKGGVARAIQTLNPRACGVANFYFSAGAASSHRLDARRSAVAVPVA